MESAEEDNLQPVADIATLLDVSIRRVQQLVADGVLPKARHGKYPVIACIQAYIRHLRELSEGASAAAERAKLLKANRQKAEMEVAKMRRELIPAEDVAREWADMVGRARAKLLGLPPRLAAHAMTCATVREAEEFARAEVYAALSELAETPDDDPAADSPGDADALAPAAA